MSAQPGKANTYRTKPPLHLWAGMILGLAAIVGTLVYGYFDIITELLTHGTARAIDGLFFYSIVMIFLLVITIVVLTILLNYKPVTVTVEPDGFFITRKKNKWHIQYIDVNELFHHDKMVFQFIFPTRQAKFEIRTRQGNASLTSKIGRFDHMVQEIESAVYPLIYSRMTAELDAGRSVQFQPFTVSADGLTYARQVNFWQDIGSIAVKNGRLEIEKKAPAGKKLAVVSAGQVPNLPVMLKIINGYLGK